MNPQKILHLSTFHPTQCGIASYTADLMSNLHDISNLSGRLRYKFENYISDFDYDIIIEEFSSYESFIKEINNSDIDVISLQHEFNIYGGTDGNYILSLLNQVQKPIVTTLHTVNKYFNPNQKKITEEIINKSSFTIVLTDQSKKNLNFYYGENPSIRVIYHGINNTKFIYPEDNEYRKQYSTDLLFVSAGHVRHSKGYHIILQALSKLKQNQIDFKFLILGSPQEQFSAGKAYLKDLKDQVTRLGLSENIIWISEYLPAEILHDYILSCDFGLVTYTESQHNSSGILPTILGCGRPVIATKFEYAIQLSSKFGNGIYLSDINDPGSLYETIKTLPFEGKARKELMKTCFEKSRDWLWKNVAEQYKEVFKEAQSISLSSIR